MAELPEIAKYTAQLDETVRGKVVASVSIAQPKATNVSEAEFNERTAGAAVERAYYRGKWILLTLDNGETLLLNVGMGADVLYFAAGRENEEKHQITLKFDDDSQVTVRFWWLGKLLLVKMAELENEPLISGVAPDPFAPKFTPEYFRDLLRGNRTGVKAFLLNQKRIGGIGNMYVHDILFEARLHPLTKISSLTDDEISGLYAAIQSVLRESAEFGTFAGERDIFGEYGHWGAELMDEGATETITTPGPGHFRVGYREGKPCPACGTAIVSMKTGSNTGYLCPACQVQR